MTEAKLAEIQEYAQDLSRPPRMYLLELIAEVRRLQAIIADEKIVPSL
jgi:hypothetical protein